MSTEQTDPKQPEQPILIQGKRKGKNGQEIEIAFFQGRLLGKGAFAKCYEMSSKNQPDKIFAGKLIDKESLTKTNARQKLYCEIKNHSSLRHPNIVRFYNYFEDEKYYYLILELCNHKTLRSLLRRRKRLTEIEVRYFLKQLLEALKYIHSQQIVHRDIKLDNIFLKDMIVKIGDLGLSVKLSDPSEKKRTICGTPNYIAPEVLAKSGHSFPADIWAVGVILYSLLVGKPPFETPKVSDTYQKIRESNYTFPVDLEISIDAKNLIQKLLNPDPELRPSIDKILSHSFFYGYTPKTLPEYTLYKSPLLEYQARGTLSPEKKTHDKIRLPLSQLVDNLSNIPKNAGDLSLVEKHRETLPNRKRSRQELKTTDQSDWSTDKFPHPKKLCLVKGTGKFPECSEKMEKTETSGVNGIGEMLEKTGIDRTLEILSDFLVTHNKENHPSSPVPVPLHPTTPASNFPSMPPPLWVSKWVDYSQKYGLGYVLCDGTVGVTFVDGTKVWKCPEESSTYYIDSPSGAPAKVETTNNDSVEPRLKKRITLHNHFKEYLTRCNSSAGLEIDTSLKHKRQGIPVFLRSWHKAKDSIMFRLSDDTFQINFFDHTKLVINPSLSPSLHHQSIATYIDKQGQKTSKILAEIHDPSHDLFVRIKYMRDCLSHYFGAKGKV